MKLKKLKLAGFKSFVDPTTVNFPSDLVAIVGPNGCGKSNTIDAVRWVMGESSAKFLRGESMADVIFNGSSARKPVGQASVELVFDNTDGAMGGEYATFSEISVKRQVSRDGQSHYYLNGSRCRRRDITGIFLGTGLGPRSYAIIQQGTISRLIEAKPEELRVYLEEVAGISKYKERRKETEQRIRHSRENLERVNDLRDELEKQLDKLQRQAQAAARYQTLNAELQRKTFELQALSWRVLNQELSQKDEVINEQSIVLESLLAEQSELQSTIEKCRVLHNDYQDTLAQAQDDYYAANNEVTRLEQALARIENQTEQLAQTLSSQKAQHAHLSGQHATDERQLVSIRVSMGTLTPERDTLQQQLTQLEQDLAQSEEVLTEWQQRWDSYQQQAFDIGKLVEVKQTQIRHSEDNLRQLANQLTRLTDEQKTLDMTELNAAIDAFEREISVIQTELANQQEQLDGLDVQVNQQRQTNKDNQLELKGLQTKINELSRDQASTNALQEAALGKHSSEVAKWLSDQALHDSPRLAQAIQVESTWETAVETVLGHYLEAVCVKDMQPLVDSLTDIEKGRIVLMEPGGQPMETAPLLADSYPALHTKVQTQHQLDGVLQGIYCVDSLEQAMSLRQQLQAYESVITPDGIWMGASWLKINKAVDETDGVLQREQVLQDLSIELADLEQQFEILQAQSEAGEDAMHQLEMARDGLRRQLNSATHQLSDKRAQMSGERSKLEHMSARANAINDEITIISNRHYEFEDTVKTTRASLADDIEQMDEHQGLKSTLLAERDQARNARDDLRREVTQRKEELTTIRVNQSRLQSELDVLTKNTARQSEQLEQLNQHMTRIQTESAALVEPLQQDKAALETALTVRVEQESALSQARDKQNELMQSLQTKERTRDELAERSQNQRNQLQQAKLEREAQHVRAQTIIEALEKEGQLVGALIETMPPEANAPEWENAITKLENSISRLGAINLAAIEEYDVQAERKAHLDKQCEDLMEALATLETAIEKIDSQTRERFKETYDTVNEHLKSLFPRMFGGGEAYLEMTGDDILDTGIMIRARPPGKQNSTIHLLSGGEKALTAIALVFALFRLSPAPFCMLDEVDAPLDDANVGRFCRLVKEMANDVQFIFITHNKVTMELAQHLMGVTMHEPGVSRLVAVDVAKAAEMVEA